MTQALYAHMNNKIKRKMGFDSYWKVVIGRSDYQNMKGK
jgi:hypothetical protein